MSWKINQNSSVFQGQFGSASESTTKQLTNEEWHSIMLYVLLNLPEAEPYKQEFICELWTASRLPVSVRNVVLTLTSSKRRGLSLNGRC
jgi:hypothetical protein